MRINAIEIPQRGQEPRKRRKYKHLLITLRKITIYQNRINNRWPQRG